MENTMLLQPEHYQRERFFYGMCIAVKNAYPSFKPNLSQIRDIHKLVDKYLVDRGLLESYRPDDVKEALNEALHDYPNNSFDVNDVDVLKIPNEAFTAAIDSLPPALVRERTTGFTIYPSDYHFVAPRREGKLVPYGTVEIKDGQVNLSKVIFRDVHFNRYDVNSSAKLEVVDPKAEYENYKFFDMLSPSNKKAFTHSNIDRFSTVQLETMNKLVQAASDSGIAFQLKENNRNHTIEFRTPELKMVVTTDITNPNSYYGSGAMFGTNYYLTLAEDLKSRARGMININKSTPVKREATASDIVSIMNFAHSIPDDNAHYSTRSATARLVFGNTGASNGAPRVSLAYNIEPKGYTLNMNGYIEAARANLAIDDLISAGKEGLAEFQSEYDISDFIDYVEGRLEFPQLYGDENKPYENIINESFEEFYVRPFSVKRIAKLQTEPGKTYTKIITELVEMKKSPDKANSVPELDADTSAVCDFFTMDVPSPRPTTPAEQQVVDKLRNDVSSIGGQNVDVRLSGDDIFINFDLNGKHFDVRRNNVHLQQDSSTPIILDDGTVIVPTLTANLSGEGDTISEKMRVTTHNQRIERALFTAVKKSIATEQTTTDVTYYNELDKYYKGNYAFKVPNYIKSLDEATASPEELELRDAIISTLAHRVKIDNRYLDEYSIIESMSTNFQKKIGQASIRTIEQEANGFFDLEATHQSSNVGVVRYLTDSASIDADGKLVKGATDDECALTKYMKKYLRSDYDSFDRRIMVFNHLLVCDDMDMSARTAYTSLFGFTQDDGIVVSERFANTHMTYVNGEARPLKKGDKMSDVHGNKGVIALVVPEDPESVDDPTIKTMSKIFKQVDVVFAPTGCMSRTNAGVLRTFTDNADSLEDLVIEDKNLTLEGAVVKAPTIILDMPVDAKTHVYTHAGEGRCASVQADWILSAGLANKFRKQLYTMNRSERLAFSEKLRVSGFVMNPDSSIHKITANDIEHGSMNIVNLPTPMLDGRTNEWHNSDNSALIQNTILGMTANSYINLGKIEGLVLPPPAIEGENGLYIPIQAAKVGTNQFYDSNLGDTFTSIECGAELKTIIGNAMRLQNNLIMRKETTESTIEEIQKAFDGYVNKMSDYVTSADENIFRHILLHQKCLPSATAVWTADPRLDIDEVAIPFHMASQMKLQDGDYVTLIRDPLIQVNGVTTMRVKVVEEGGGIAVNPCAAPMFDGDFDGDSIGIFKQTDGLQHELMKLDVYHHAFDKKIPDNAESSLTLAQDVAIGRKNLGLDPITSTSAEFDIIKEDIASDVTSMVTDAKPLNDAVKDALANSYGVYIGGRSPQAVFDNCMKLAAVSESDPQGIVDKYGNTATGAKGSFKKISEYFKYGHFDVDENGTVTPSQGWTTEELEHLRVAAQQALAIKKEGTAITGTNAQLLIDALRGSTTDVEQGRQLVNDVLSVTSQLTQAMLDAKQDAVKAYNRMYINMKLIPQLLRGNDVIIKEDITKSEVTTDALPKDLFVENIEALHSIMGVDESAINKEAIKRIADALSPDGKTITSVRELTTQTHNKIDALVYGRYDNLKILNEMAADEANQKIFSEICSPLRQSTPACWCLARSDDLNKPVVDTSVATPELANEVTAQESHPDVVFHGNF